MLSPLTRIFIQSAWSWLRHIHAVRTDYRHVRLVWTLWRPLLPYGYSCIEHPVPDRVKPSFLFFDILTLWRSGLSTHNATVGVKGLSEAGERERWSVNECGHSVTGRQSTRHGGRLRTTPVRQLELTTGPRQAGWPARPSSWPGLTAQSSARVNDT